MNHVLLISLVLLIGKINFAYAVNELEEDVSSLIHRIYGSTPSSADPKVIRELSASQKEAIRQEAYRRLQDPDKWNNGQPDGWFIRVLMSIDDDWARDVFASQFRERPDQGWLLWATFRDPKLIAWVGDMLLLNDVITQEDYEAGYAGRQSWTATALLDTLGNSPAFSADVINWARRLNDSRSRQTLDIMREWWKANEAPLKANDFKAVQPGRSLPIEETREPAIAPTLIANPASPKVVELPVTKLPSPPASTSSSMFLWTGAVLTIALLITLLVFWKRRP